MPEYIMQMLTASLMQGKSKTSIPNATIEILDKRLMERKAEQKVLDLCVKRNTKGSEYEKAGKISMAIKTYEANIVDGCHPALHAFERLMVIYRKQKKFEEEIRVIDRAIEVLCPRYPDLRDKYQSRRLKAEALKAKQP